MNKMTMQERIERDGPRWRYIKLLEDELEKRKTRQLFIRGSLALNVFLVVMLFLF